MAGGRQERTDSPAERRRAAPEGLQRSGRPGATGLRHAAAGLQGGDGHPPDRVPEAQRRAAQRRVRSQSAQRCPAPAALHEGRSLESGRPSRRRAHATVCQPPLRPRAGSSVPRGTKALRPLASPQERDSVRPTGPAFRFSRLFAGARVSRSLSKLTEAPQRDSGRRSGVERDHVAGVRPCNITKPPLGSGLHYKGTCEHFRVVFAVHRAGSE